MNTKASLRIVALGESQVTITVGAASGQVKLKAKPLALLHFALHRKVFSRVELFEALWPHLKYPARINNLHVTKNSLTEALAAAVPGVPLPELLVYKYNLYYLNNQDYVATVLLSETEPHYSITSDLEEWEKAASTLMDKSRAEVSDWLKLIGTQGGSFKFLSGVNHSWLAARRQEVQARFVDVLMRAARDVAHEAPKLAFNWYSEAARLNVLRDDAHRGVMQMYHALGMTANIRTYYLAMVDILWEQHALLPAPETRELYKELTG